MVLGSLRLAASLSAVLLLLGASPGIAGGTPAPRRPLAAAPDGGDIWLMGLAPPADGGDARGATDADPSTTAERLAAAEAELAARLGRPLVLRQRYLRGWPGIAVDLRPAEAAALRQQPPSGWRAPVPNESFPLAMDLSPALIGAPAAWALATPAGGPGSRGEGMLLGIVDGGVAPEHPSFASLAEDGYLHRWTERGAANGFLGWCHPDHPKHQGSWACNDKLVGLYSWPEAGDDPRDDLGHGSHVAAIAVGNPLAEAWLEGPGGRQTRSISGIAPRAHLVSYDACRGMACPSSAILAAIDQAMADGVDVLNLSIALSQVDPWQDPVALALLAARAQGISVTAAAGNSGAAGTVAMPAPWVLSVGASSHGRDLVNGVWEDNPARRDRLAAFSAQGPARATRCCRRPGLGLSGVGLDLLKPDLVAPGVEVLSADLGPGIAVLPRSGTSMAAPQTAGALAVLGALHPGWSAAERQSALLLSAAPLILGAGQRPRLGAGAGRLDLDAAARAGLVMDAKGDELRQAGNDPVGLLRDLNLPALVDGACYPSCAFRRSLRGAAGTELNWTATVDLQAPGSPLRVTVKPSTFRVAPGEALTLTVEMTPDGAMDPEAWIEGSLRLVPDDPRRPDAVLPLLLRPRPALLPPAIALEVAELAGEAAVEGAAGSAQRPPALGGTLGLTRATRQTLLLAPDPSPQDPYDDAGGTARLILDQPGQSVERMVAEVIGTSARDLDLYLGPDSDGDGRPSAAEQACAANLIGALELCEVVDPAPGPWWVLLQNWQGSGAAADEVVLATGAVAAPFAGRALARWATGTGGTRPELRLSWTLPEISPSDRWYGVLRPTADDGRVLQPVPVDLYVRDAAPEPSPTPGATAGAEPSATPLPTAPATASSTATAPAMPTATTPPTAAAGPSCICAAASRAPAEALRAALDQPERVAGWNRPANPNLPPGPWNPLRRCLTLERTDRGWHPLFNGWVFRAGCP